MDDAAARLNAKKAEIEEVLTEAMEKALLMIESDAKRNCPVDEGLLRASINHQVESDSKEVRGRISTNVSYAPYVEFGSGIYAQDGNGRKTPWAWTGESIKWEGSHLTKGQKGKRFMQKAMDSNRDKIAEVFKDATGGLK